MDDFDFLKNYHLKLIAYLIDVFNTGKQTIKWFLNDAFYYSGREYTGVKLSMGLKRIY